MIQNWLEHWEFQLQSQRRASAAVQLLPTICSMRVYGHCEYGGIDNVWS